MANYQKGRDKGAIETDKIIQIATLTIDDIDRPNIAKQLSLSGQTVYNYQKKLRII